MKGKRKRRDVTIFSENLSSNIYHLHEELKNKTYTYSPYIAFNISDPKPRNIHKASVRDRLLHHSIYRVLYPYFDKKFIYDSYSCRLSKGTHKAMNRFKSFGYKVSKNHTKTCWVLKCDIKKFFASIDHNLLQYIVAKYISDKDTLWLLGRVINSFETTAGKGLPLGNLTSQLLVNIYMNEFDQFVKHKLKVKYYIRYADDFIVTTIYRSELENLLPKIEKFLKEELKLLLHPNKVFIKTLASGVDFLGWVHFPTHRVLRTSTKRRMFKNLKNNSSRETRTSYLGLLRHGDTYKLRQKL
ncbi:MAG: reverse transcriptase/maturase family protein [Patescibacteria group bacterium]